MTATKVQIANQALTLCRSQTIESFDEDSNEAQIVKNLYDPHVDSVVASYPWASMMKRETLVRLAHKPLTKYEYAYALPPDYKRLWAVYGNDDLNGSPIQEYRLTQIQDQPAILTNCDKIIVEYVVRLDESLWRPTFRQLVVYSLGAELALPLTDDVNLQGTLQQQAYGTPSEQGYGGRFAIATTADSQQNPPVRYESPLTHARFGGTPYRRF